MYLCHCEDSLVQHQPAVNQNMSDVGTPAMTQLYSMYLLFLCQGRGRLRQLSIRRQQKRRQDMFAAIVFVATVNATTVNRSLWMRERSDDWWERIVLGSFNEDEWMANFRMSRNMFVYICEKLRPALSRRTTLLRSSVPVEKRVAAALWYFATGSGYRTVSHLFGVSSSTVCQGVYQVARALRSVFGHCIELPKGERLCEVVNGFEERWRFPQCVGAIDGTHIPIIAPEHNATGYFNRKGCHSVVLQAVVDHQYRFTNINVGWPGSVHDARVLRNSTLFEMAENDQLFPQGTRDIEGTPVPLMLLGDPAYPLQTWLMKAYPDHGHLTQQQDYFNYRLSQARMTVECSFGRLKGRWRCLLKRMDVHIIRVPHVVTACCILHNLCEIHAQGFDETWMEPAQEHTPNAPDLPQPQEAEPHVVRDALARLFSQQRGNQ